MSASRILLSLALLPALAPAAAFGQGATDLAGMALDPSGRLEGLRPVERGDLRDNLALFGQRPTLVVVASVVPWRKSDAKEYVGLVKDVDKLARKWERAGADVLFVAHRARIHDAGGGEPSDLELIEKAKAKHMICAYVDAGGADLSVSEPVLERLLQPVYTAELELRWFLIEELGRIGASGSDVFADELDERREAIEPPAVAEEPATRKIFAAIDEWRLGEAEALLARLDASSSAEKERAGIEALRARLERSEEHYREVFSRPHDAEGRLVEALESLEHLARQHFAEGASADRILAEVEEARRAPEFERALAQRALYLEMLAAFDEMNAEVERTYQAAMGKNRGYDERKYNQAILDVYPETLAKLQAFVEENQDSPYRARIARTLSYAREELQDARQLASDGR